MKEEFNKLNDYTLRVDLKVTENDQNGQKKYNGYTKLFNFFSRQVTTIHRDWLGEGRGSDSGGSAGVTSKVFIESFDDLPSAKEIEFMHAKLVALGGKPPALDEVLQNQLVKKAATSLRPTGT